MKMKAATVVFVLLCLFGQLQAVNINGKRSGSVVLMEIINDRIRNNQKSAVDTSYASSTNYIMLGSGETSDAKVADRMQRDTFDVVIDLDSVVSGTGPKFVGVAIDSGVFRRIWNKFDVKSKTLRSLAKGLFPSIIRIGGTAADFFIFNVTASPGENFTDSHNVSSCDYEYEKPCVDKPVIMNYTVSADEWKKLNYFVQEAGWDLMFDFNEFLRQGDRWDPDNARQLLAFSNEQNYTIPCFQLGNEPNSYHHNFNFSIPGSRLASDMQQLQSLLYEFPAYNKSRILGPDVTKVTRKSAQRYLQDFLQAGGHEVVAAVTLHHYYFNAKDSGAGLDDFINTTLLDSLKEELNIGISTANSFAPGRPVWLSETSSVSGGGLPGMSNAYVAGFMWLDKLGLSALYGLQTVIRQSFYLGKYALVADDFTPYPDYYLTVLYKRLVQGPVFRVTTSSKAVRVYASCANPSTYQKGALTIYILNVQNEATTFNFTQFAGQQYELYLLTPGDDDGLKSAYVALNGEKLTMVDGDLPPLPPLICSGRITFPAFSFGFLVIPQANVNYCLQ